MCCTHDSTVSWYVTIIDRSGTYLFSFWPSLIFSGKKELCFSFHVLIFSLIKREHNYFFPENIRPGQNENKYVPERWIIVTYQLTVLSCVQYICFTKLNKISWNCRSGQLMNEAVQSVVTRYAARYCSATSSFFRISCLSSCVEN